MPLGKEWILHGNTIGRPSCMVMFAGCSWNSLPRAVTIEAFSIHKLHMYKFQKLQKFLFT